jgi:hypothetical protein
VIEPTVDEAKFQQAQRVVKVAALRGIPLDDDSCANCLYYLEPGEQLSFCWHDKLQINVAASWWCHFWEMIADE